MKPLRLMAVKTVLTLLALGSIARADDLQTIIAEGKPCPLWFDLANGGTWRNLSPTLNDLLLCPGFTFTTTGLA